MLKWTLIIKWLDIQGTSKLFPNRNIQKFHTKLNEIVKISWKATKHGDCEINTEQVENINMELLHAYLRGNWCCISPFKLLHDKCVYNTNRSPMKVYTHLHANFTVIIINMIHVFAQTIYVLWWCNLPIMFIMFIMFASHNAFQRYLQFDVTRLISEFNNQFYSKLLLKIN